MKLFLNAAKLLLLDLASSIVFLIAYLLTDNIQLSVGLGVALGLAQIGTQFARGKPIETMEWLSLFLVIGAGAAALLTNNPSFVLFKPGWFTVIVGILLLTPAWFIPFLPPTPKPVSPIAPVFVAS